MVYYSALDCFTIIQVPLMVMGRQYYVVHGVGPAETGAHYIRSELKNNNFDHYNLRNMGYMWSHIIDWTDPVSVVQLCRDTKALPDYVEHLSKPYNDAKLEDVAIKDDIPRWVKVFQYHYGDTTNQDDDIFRQEILSPGCSPHNTGRCTSKDIIKLAHMGLIAVDGEYNGLIENMRSNSGDIPTYTFNEIMRVEDIVDKTIIPDTAVRTTLATDSTGGETAIVLVLGRVHLIRRDTGRHAWYLIDKVGSGGSGKRLLSLELETLTIKRFTKLCLASVSDKRIVYPEFLTYPGTAHTQQLSGYFGRPQTVVPTISLMFDSWWKKLLVPR